jgi:hypothetical protein
MKIAEQFTKNNFIQTAKNKKLNFLEFTKIFKYTAYKHIKIKINNVAYCGYVYRLYSPSVQAIEQAKKKYNNIVFYNGCVEYAPELKTVWLFIATKSIKSN